MKLSRIFVEGIISFLVIFIPILRLLDFEYISGDNYYYIPTSISIICEHNLDINEFSELPVIFSVEKINGHKYNYFPLGPSLVSMPVALHRCDRPDSVTTELVHNLNHRMASIMFAATAAVIFIISRALLHKWYWAVFYTTCIMFGSSMFSSGVTEFWQQSVSMLLNSVVLCILVFFLNEDAVILSKTPRTFLFGILGLTLALAFISRPSNIYMVIGVSVWLVLKYWATDKKDITLVFAIGLILAVGFVLLNLSVFDNVLPAYYSPERLSGFEFEGLAGLLFSPARGLLVYTPLVLFSVAGFRLGIKNPVYKSLLFTILFVLSAHMLSHASYYHWWGGHSFGPRIILDMLPYYLFPIIFLIQSWENRKYRNTIPLFVFVALISIFIHSRILSPEVATWNIDPVNVDNVPSRLWDWVDIPFMRGL